jgi:pyruvate dehydrogenase E2 component (dihydrolipoamide acetyltransferase)
VVHVAGLMTPTALTAALARLESRGADGRGPGGAEPVEVTVVDLGSYGAQEATLDATPTRPAVLTIGAVTEQAVVRDGALMPGKVLTLTLSCDEGRLGAGAAARWLALLADLLENPLQFLT